jgi:SDR family mycofactocin-dependent oxidoreductase
VAVPLTRAAVVTGAARGIGAATVLALARRGWAVLAVDSCTDDPSLPYAMASQRDMDALVQDPSAEGRVISYIADVRDGAALSRAIEYAEREWGGVDAAVAAAGVIAGGRPQWHVPAEQERAVIDVNLVGVLNLARAAVPALLRRPVPRSGRFVAVASAAATRGLPNLTAYCASKAGVTGLIRALAVELAASGITANAVSPGSTDTPLLQESARLYELGDVEQFAQHHPIGRLLQPDEVAAAVVFLIAPSSGAITGAVLPVDGGMAV